MRTREELVSRLAAGTVPDIVIVGGGVNGVGVYRDLAAQGVPSLLVEAGDFASGTSAAPSRLIHGGLRYLETGEAALVRESLTERNLLLRNARHVVHPQPVWVPLRSWLAGSLSAVARFLHMTRRPGAKGAVPVKLGLMLYDLFGRAHQTMPDHRMLGARKARSEMPALAGDIVAVGEYYDARITHPERLVMELIADAEEDCPEALALPYVSAGQSRDGVLMLTDNQTGARHGIRPRIVINAAGAWVDKVQDGLGFSEKLMGGTRGTHLVLKKPGLAEKLGGRMLYFETSDHRACLALPFDAHHIYVGTTDIRVSDPEERDYTEAEIDYIFDVLRPVLPGEALGRGDIVFVMAGIRPLPLQKTDVTGEISRDHRLDIFEPTAERPFTTMTLVGGKWTTYRAFGEQVADRVLSQIGQARRQSTADLPIGGARGLPETAEARARWVAALAAETGLDPTRCATLTERYGSGARALAQAEMSDHRRFRGLDAYTPAEIAHICRVERVTRLEDVVLRRTLMGFEGLVTRDSLEQIADAVAEALSWDAARRAAEIDATVRLLRERHRVALDEAA
ncbi:glycerol-3-phosphate dehydrogenase/oxidase [Salipiger abyssi]|uniref:glycerol-3-phosphate dehydrogenase/oxidase n=1 Tax=Salipiger abyssi TaxID=1250539 RepID=UPI00405894DB